MSEEEIILREWIAQDLDEEVTRIRNIEAWELYTSRLTLSAGQVSVTDHRRVAGC